MHARSGPAEAPGATGRALEVPLLVLPQAAFEAAQAGQLRRAERALIRLRAAYGTWCVVLLSTIVAVTASILVSIVLVWFLLGADGFKNPFDFYLAVLVPLIVSPPMMAYVLRILGVVAQVSADQTLLARQYRELAERDQLTGALNRRGLFQGAEQLPDGSVVVVADVNGFKLVNDLHGHHIGDLALVRVSQALIELAGDGGFVARTGGDEFVLLMHAAATRMSVPGQMQVHVTESLTVSVSLGTSLHVRDRSLDETLALADAAMYQIKQDQALPAGPTQVRPAVRRFATANPSIPTQFGIARSS